MNIKREAGLDPDTPTFLDGPTPHGASPMPHHHLNPPSNRVVISLRDEDRERGHSRSASSPTSFKYNQAGMDTDQTRMGGDQTRMGTDQHRMGTDQARMGNDVDGHDAGLTSQGDLRGSKEVEDEDCVRVSPAMAEDYPLPIPGGFMAGREESYHRHRERKEHYDRELDERENYERELAGRENYQRQFADQENYERELADQANYERETAERESFERDLVDSHRYEREYADEGSYDEQHHHQQQEVEDMVVERQKDGEVVEGRRVEREGGERQEDEEEGLRIEGPQPNLEASDDDFADSLPVFPVPHLQPVTSS